MAKNVAQLDLCKTIWDEAGTTRKGGGFVDALTPSFLVFTTHTPSPPFFYFLFYSNRLYLFLLVLLRRDANCIHTRFTPPAKDRPRAIEPFPRRGQRA